MQSIGREGHRANPGLNLALGQVAMPDQSPAASGIGLIRMRGEKSVQLGLDRLCNQLPSAPAQKIRQRIG